MGDDHPIVQRLIPFSEVEADDFGRGAVSSQVNTEVKPSETASEAYLAEPKRGVPAQTRTLVDNNACCVVEVLHR